MRLRRRLVGARVSLRTPTARWRVLPDVLVIGAQRCGTSSLYRYLGAHPHVVASVRKETEYLSRFHARGELWYRAHFPLSARLAFARAWGSGRVTFEATPDYLLHPWAPERAARVMRGAKLVVLLRDPVARAHSHYRHMRRLGYESLSFADALATEDERIAGDVRRLQDDPGHNCKAYLRYSYRTRGLYAEQLERWFEWFAPHQLLAERAEDFYARPAEVYRRIVAFLGLAPWEPRAFPNHSAVDGSASEPLDPALRDELEAFFAPENARLYRLLGRDLGWTPMPGRRDVSASVSEAGR